ncbi:MAG TPA: hypothetical protein VNH82_04025 [Candidatus Dormibacteraeota bacterium]|nr:hypothetical protein [Candidatus Dormibacteraeota bacterium]
MTRWPRAFALFCYEFAVGDTPELAIGVGLVIVATWALAGKHSPLGFWFIQAAVTLLLAVSLWRGAVTKART